MKVKIYIFFVCVILCMPLISIAQDKCTIYKLKDGLDSLVLPTVKPADVLEEDSFTFYPQTYTIKANDVFYSDNTDDSFLIVSFNSTLWSNEKNSYIYQNAPCKIPLSNVICFGSIPIDKRREQCLQILREMGKLVDSEKRKGAQYNYQYSLITQKYFFTSYYVANSYISRADLDWIVSDSTLFDQFLFDLCADYWGDSGEGRLTIAQLFTLHPKEFADSYNRLKYSADKEYAGDAILFYFQRNLFVPPLRTDSDNKEVIFTLFKQYSGMEPWQRANKILKYYEPYLHALNIESNRFLSKEN